MIEKEQDYVGLVVSLEERKKRLLMCPAALLLLLLVSALMNKSRSIHIYNATHNKKRSCLDSQVNKTKSRVVVF